VAVFAGCLRYAVAERLPDRVYVAVTGPTRTPDLVACGPVQAEP